MIISTTDKMSGTEGVYAYCTQEGDGGEDDGKVEPEGGSIGPKDFTGNFGYFR